MESEKRILDFFKGYENLYRRALKDPDDVDARKLANHFAESFVESSPGGAHGGRNGWMFRFMIGRGFAFYRKIGTREMNITNVEVTSLEAGHAMANVSWEARVARKDGREIVLPFSHTYFLRTDRKGPKIFAYIANDQQKMLEEHGLVPKKRK